MVVEVPVSTRSLSDAMSRMRNWLEEHRCTPILFSTASDESGVVLIRVEFDAAADALAFKASFGPVEPQAPAAAV